MKREWNDRHHHAGDSRGAELCPLHLQALRRLGNVHKAPEDAEMEEGLRLHVDIIADE